MKYANRDEFFNSVDKQRVRELYISLFKFADKNGYRINLGQAGFSLSITGASGKLYTLLYGYGGDAANKNNSIETTFALLKETGSCILEQYRNEICMLDFFEQTPSMNYRWYLSDASTDKQINSLMAVIKDIADKNETVVANVL